MSKFNYAYYHQYLEGCDKGKLKEEILDLRTRMEREEKEFEDRVVEERLCPIDAAFEEHNEEISTLGVMLETAEHLYKTKFGELDFLEDIDD